MKKFDGISNFRPGKKALFWIKYLIISLAHNKFGSKLQADSISSQNIKNRIGRQDIKSTCWVGTL